MGSEDLVLNFLKLLGLSKGESVALSFALSFSNNKTLAMSGRRALRTKLPEIVSGSIFAEIPEDIRTNLVHVIQTDEVSQCAA